MNTYTIKHWITEAQLNGLGYSDYWNNEENEKNKEWYILDGNFSKMESYLEKRGLVGDLKQCVDCLKTHFKRELAGVGIDLAAGNLWAVPHLLKLGRIEKLYCLEYSKHRLLHLGPKVLEHYQVPPEKVTLVLGCFYDLHLKDHTLDFVILSQAFHHADQPEKLLTEIRRVLKPTGIVLIMGEHLMNYAKASMKNALKFIIAHSVPPALQQRLCGKTLQAKKFWPTTSELFPPDPVLGDHFYTIQEYRAFLQRMGLRLKHLKNRRTKFQSFVLVGI